MVQEKGTPSQSRDTVRSNLASCLAVSTSIGSSSGTMGSNVPSFNRRDDVVKVFREIRSKINQKIKKSGIPIKYQLASNGGRGSISYGINITPDQIDLKIDSDFVKTSGEDSP